ncbi:MAG: tetratricopeptide repeat protein [Halobacteriota archaeon]
MTDAARNDGNSESGPVTVVIRRRIKSGFAQAYEALEKGISTDAAAQAGYLGSTFLRPEKALYWYRQAGERSDTLAYVNIGWFFEKGLAVEQDYKQALHWYKKGAVVGEPHAMNNLGAMYESGLGVQKDQKKAEYWYAKAREALARGALDYKQFLESPATEIN